MWKYNYKTHIGTNGKENSYLNQIKKTQCKMCCRCRYWNKRINKNIWVSVKDVSNKILYEGYINEFTDLVNFNECVNGGEYMTIWDVKHEDKEIESIIRREIDDKNNSLSANELMWSIGYMFDLTDRNEEVFIKLLKKYTLNECFNLNIRAIIRQYQAECS